jgi:hypothetical protein
VCSSDLEAALRMSHELETAIRQEAKERNSKEANQETNNTKIEKEE